MESTLALSLTAAFLGGLVSFFSPCVLPLLPVYTAMIAGAGTHYVRNITAFFTGFLLTFVALGATASLIGQWIFVYQDLLRQLGALIMIIMGMQLAGWFPVKWLKLSQDQRPFLRHNQSGLIGAFLMGMGFMIGWTPCVGPILASIFVVASTTEKAGQGVWLLTIYALGFLIPFVVLSVLYQKYVMTARFFYRYLEHVQKAAGVLLIIFGVILYADWLQKGLALFG